MLHSGIAACCPTLTDASLESPPITYIALLYCDNKHCVLLPVQGGLPVEVSVCGLGAVQNPWSVTLHHVY